jgi:anti-anti-sigma regulatory factor
LDQARVGELKAMLAGALASGAELDASAVQRVSTLCFQLLLATCKSASDAGNKVIITNSSEEFRRGAAVLGLTSAFGLEIQ